jgi:beta-glucosidase
VSAFPADIHLIATFDCEVMLRYGREYGGKSIHVVLGPFIGSLGRVVRSGRDWEALEGL